MAGFEKRMISLRYWLLASKMFHALRAMEYGTGHHTGVRKDKVTPEFDHQVTIAHYVRTLVPHLDHPEETFCTVFLHDVREDYGVSDEEIRSKFGSLVADAVGKMTKEFRGVRIDDALIFEGLSGCPIASVAKGGDRVHNMQSMAGVFNLRKQKEYISEVENLFMPMLKKARRKFPTQEGAYENIKLILRGQVDLFSAAHAGTVASN